jgi:DNA-binding HxlR family transcriptional regulator
MPADEDLRRLVADLAERVARLEVAGGAPAPARAAGDWWALEGLRERIDDEGGRVVLAGDVRVGDGRRCAWQEEYLAAHLAARAWPPAADALGALGHPVRLTLLRALFQGRSTVRELCELPGVGTTGQVYHHLRELQAAGWVRQEARNVHVIPPDRVVPLLVVLAAVGLGRRNEE